MHLIIWEEINGNCHRECSQIATNPWGLLLLLLLFIVFALCRLRLMFVYSEILEYKVEFIKNMNVIMVYINFTVLDFGLICHFIKYYILNVFFCWGVYSLSIEPFLTSLKDNCLVLHLLTLGCVCRDLIHPIVVYVAM